MYECFILIRMSCTMLKSVQYLFCSVLVKYCPPDDGSGMSSLYISYTDIVLTQYFIAFVLSNFLIKHYCVRMKRTIPPSAYV